MSGIQEIHTSSQKCVRIQSANRLIGIENGREKRNPLEKRGLGHMSFNNDFDGAIKFLISETAAAHPRRKRRGIRGAAA
jgi:hypothetical protein